MTNQPRNGDDDDNGRSDREDATHWRNAYWAKVREQEGTSDPDNFGGQFRGVKAAPHGGAAHVRPDDTLGAAELCWCGLPLDHMWPGRTVGTRHPSEEQMKTMTAHVDRRDLRAYHRTIQDFLLQCINTDDLRFRISKNSVILYPPDGTQPVTVYARNSERQVRTLTKWYTEHVREATDDKHEASPEQLERLAEATNDPGEHPPTKRSKKRIRKVEDVELPPAEPPSESVAPVSPAVEYQDTPADPADYMPEQDTEPEPEVEEEPEAEPEEAEAEEEPEGEWVPMQRKGKEPSPNIEVNGIHVRCKWCEDTDHPLRSTNRRSVGGHNRIYHTPSAEPREVMWSSTARERAMETRRERLAAWAKVQEAAALINDALGVESDTERIEQLETENTELRTRAEEAERRVEELDAKLALIREATGL